LHGREILEAATDRFVISNEQPRGKIELAKVGGDQLLARGKSPAEEDGTKKGIRGGLSGGVDEPTDRKTVLAGITLRKGTKRGTEVRGSRQSLQCELGGKERVGDHDGKGQLIPEVREQTTGAGLLLPRSLWQWVGEGSRWSLKEKSTTERTVGGEDYSGEVSTKGDRGPNLQFLVEMNLARRITPEESNLLVGKENAISLLLKPLPEGKREVRGMSILLFL